MSGFFVIVYWAARRCDRSMLEWKARRKVVCDVEVDEKCEKVKAVDVLHMASREAVTAHGRGRPNTRARLQCAGADGGANFGLKCAVAESPRIQAD